MFSISTNAFIGYTINAYHATYRDLFRIILSDGAQFISRIQQTISPIGYSDYMQNTLLYTNSNPTNDDPINQIICYYQNTTCSGQCGWHNRPERNSILREYNSSGQIVYRKSTASDSTVNFDFVKDAYHIGPLMVV